MSEVQLVRGDAGAASTVRGPEFVDVTVDATGEETQVPAEWVGHPVLGKGFTVVATIDTAEVGEPPTDRSTKDEIAAYAKTAGIDLGDASTKAGMLEVIDAAVAAAGDTGTGGPAPDASPNPDVQLIAGTGGEESLIPAVRDAATQDPDGTEPSDENPPSGEEN